MMTTINEMLEKKAQKEEKSQTTSVYVRLKNPEMKKRLEEIAQDWGLSVTEVMRTALEKFVGDYDEENKL